MSDTKDVLTEDNTKPTTWRTKPTGEGMAEWLTIGAVLTLLFFLVLSGYLFVQFSHVANHPSQQLKDFVFLGGIFSLAIGLILSALMWGQAAAIRNTIAIRHLLDS